MTERVTQWKIFQGDDGQWAVRFKDPVSGSWRNKRIPRHASVRTKRQAEAWAKDWVREGIHRPPAEPSNDPTLAEYLSRWIERRERNRERVRRTTLANNKGHVEHHINPKLGAMKLSDLTPPLLRDWLTELLKKDKRNADGEVVGSIAAYTVRNVAATLRAALDDANDDGLIASNPMRSKAVRKVMPKPATRAGRNVIVHLPKADAERLLTLDGLPDERQARYLLALTSGLRDGEIAGLTWADVATDHEVPHVEVNKAFDTNWQMGPPKNENAYRKVPLHPLMLEALARWKAGGFVLMVGRHAKRTDPVFPNDKGNHHRPRTPEWLRSDLKRAGCPTSYAGVPLEFRALRRSFATWLAEAEVTDGLRKRLMGHGAAGVTDGHYTAKTLAALRDAVLKIALDLSTGDVVPMRMRKASGGDGGSGGDEVTEGFAPLFAPSTEQGILAPVAKAGGSAWESNPPDDVLHAAPSVLKTEGRTSVPSASARRITSSARWLLPLARDREPGASCARGDRHRRPRRPRQDVLDSGAHRRRH